MATDVQDHTIEEKIAKLRELFADAPDVGKQALENALKELTSQASEETSCACAPCCPLLP